jgi:PPK2 family polyphosphate:nucleotide phosphotransferase
MPDLNELREAFRARPVDGFVNLAGYDPAWTPFIDSKSDAKDDLDDDLPDQLFDQHELLFAGEDQSLLLILQGLDCSGKNGTIKHVVIHMNPAGVRTASFKEPTEEEQEHDFLWRYRKELPKPGQLGVFDRSYYEDVIVPTALGELDEDQIDHRMEQILEFEQKLTASGTRLVKCMLNISYDEQRYRLLRRLRRDDKRWKFSVEDIETRRHWNDFQAAFSKVIGRTTTEQAPWFIIPADHKWYRNWAIAHLLVTTVDSMGLDYPQPDLDLDDLRSKLEPPT